MELTPRQRRVLRHADGYWAADQRRDGDGMRRQLKGLLQALEEGASPPGDVVEPE